MLTSNGRHPLRVTLNHRVSKIPLKGLESSKLLIEFVAHRYGTGKLLGPEWSGHVSKPTQPPEDRAAATAHHTLTHRKRSLHNAHSPRPQRRGREPYASAGAAAALPFLRPRLA